MHTITASPGVAADYARAVSAERRRTVPAGPRPDAGPRRPRASRILTAVPRLRLRRPVVLA